MTRTRRPDGRVESEKLRGDRGGDDTQYAGLPLATPRSLTPLAAGRLGRVNFSRRRNPIEARRAAFPVRRP